MKPFLIVYFSGAGNTRVTAEKIKKLIEIKKHAEIYSVEKLPDSFDINDYSAVILGTPTYHSEPAAPLMKFVNTLHPIRKIPAFIFATCGLYPENCLHILAKECLKHNIVTVHSASYRCSATDGMLIAPFMKLWYENEKDLPLKIKRDLDIFADKLKSHANADIPKLKWYAPLNYPNKILGKNTTFPVYLHGDRCIKCGKCLKNCPTGAISEKNGYPVINKSECMNCYRCIHHCPSLALSLSERKPVQKVWSE